MFAWHIRGIYALFTRKNACSKSKAEDMKTLRILVPLDETPASVKALDAVHGLTAAVDFSLVELLHVEQANDSAGPADRQMRQAHAEEFLAREAAAVAGPQVEVSYRVGWGDPVEVILQSVRDAGFDFICMTTRAVPNNTAQPGSVAARLFRESPVPIIAFPASSAIPGEAAHHPERAFFRAAVQLPAELEVEGVKHPIPIVIRDLGAKGAELETYFDQPLPPTRGKLILTLPTRPEPLEIATKTVSTQHRTADSGQALQILHVTFPTIGMGHQDAIVAFLNKLRMFQQQQRVVSAAVRIEVITGPRAYATFKGRTRVVRPDYVWLHMETFDHIEGADVGLRVQSADGAATLEVDGTVTSIKIAGEGFDVEVEIAEPSVGHENPGQKLMAFIRQHFRAESDLAPAGSTDANAAGEAQVLIPRPSRGQRAQQPLARVLTASPGEAGVPRRARREGVEVPLKRRVRDAEERALESILLPHRKSPPLRSI